MAFHWNSSSTHTDAPTPLMGHIHTHLFRPFSCLLTCQCKCQPGSGRGGYCPSSVSPALAGTAQSMEKDPANFCWMNRWIKSRAVNEPWMAPVSRPVRCWGVPLGKWGGLAAGPQLQCSALVGPMWAGTHSGAPKHLPYKLSLCLRLYL